jgi:hypothetical protein
LEEESFALLEESRVQELLRGDRLYLQEFLIDIGSRFVNALSDEPLSNLHFLLEFLVINLRSFRVYHIFNELLGAKPREHNYEEVHRHFFDDAKQPLVLIW